MKEKNLSKALELSKEIEQLDRFEYRFRAYGKSITLKNLFAGPTALNAATNCHLNDTIRKNVAIALQNSIIEMKSELNKLLLESEETQ